MGTQISWTSSYLKTFGIRSNLWVIRLVSDQLKGFLTINNILNPFQSGFRKRYSTITAATKAVDDTVSAIECNINDICTNVAAAVRLYDTIIHSMARSPYEALKKMQYAFTILQKNLLKLKLVLNSKKNSSNVQDLLQIVTLYDQEIERVACY